ncbi:MAG: hypothetical protein V3W18_07615 [candidate division Zixibacteria bacterium]
MFDTILKIYEKSPTLLYTMFFSIFLILRAISFHIKSRYAKTPYRSVEGRLLEYVTKETPWYFTVLFLLLIISGLLAIVSKEATFYESFKYISGSMVGALIGMADKFKSKEGNDSTDAGTT